MTDCIFCNISQGTIPSQKVYEDDVVYAFLDLTQVTPGHTLVIPKTHVQDIFAYEADLMAEVGRRLPKIAQGIMKAFPQAKGMNIVSNNGQEAYQSVFHSHWHLIPRYGVEDGFEMAFKDQSDHFTDEEFQAHAEKIRQALEVE